MMEMMKLISSNFLKRGIIMNKILYSVVAGIIAIGIVLVFPKALVTVLIMFILGLLVIR